MHHSTRLLAFGFIVILMMMISLALIAFYYNSSTSDSVNLTVTRKLEKINLINELSTVIHNRTRYMQSMLMNEDASVDARALSDFNRFNGSYDETRERLLPLLAPREREIMLTIDILDHEISELNQQVSVLFMNGSRTAAGNILLSDVLPKTAPLLAHLSELTQAQRLDVQKVLLVAATDAEENQIQFAMYAVFSILVSLGVAVMAVWYGQKLSAQLEEINRYLEEKVEERTEDLLVTQRELLEDNTELARLALTDSVTGLSNRTHMGQILQKEFSRFVRHAQRFGIIMIDIDHFKQVNDGYGHDVGDRMLTQLSRKFEQATRNSDSISRWGGEEFLICCTTISENDLYPIAENIRKMIEDSDFEIAENITISLGCAMIQEDEKIYQLIKRADVALYAAKNNGRNQTVVSEFAPLWSNVSPG
jgi:diguanylate cyclase (GGDEF)-like protein